MTTNEELEKLEIKLLLEGLHQHYGFDFRNYAQTSLRRRIKQMMLNEKLDSVSGLQERILHSTEAMERLLLQLTVNVTSMFRDPVFYLALRHKVIPLLRTYPFIRIWHAGCSTGEEAYSMAILLQEEGLYEKCRIYATDMNESVLKIARAGIFPLRFMQEFTQNYLRAGGSGSFSDYYAARYESAIFDTSLKRNLIFGHHNLVTDASFNEFNLILCRNVMIYFNRELQTRVFHLLHESLATFGVLALGSKESMILNPHEQCYEEIDKVQKLYRRLDE